MSADAQRFAQVVLDGLAAAGLFTDRAIGSAGGPSTSTMTLLRKVARGEISMSEPREPTWSNIDKAAGWEPGSARRVWAGSEPVGGSTEDDTYVASPGARAISGVTNEEVLRELREMQQRIDELSRRLANG